MQTIAFQKTVEKFKKGMGNMTNIFVSQLKNFPVLLTDKQGQINIANEIEIEIAKQNTIKAQIDKLRSEIDAIIENAILTNITII